MKRLAAFLITFLCAYSLIAQDSYQVYINLAVVKDDRVQVTINTPKVDSENIEFRVPKIVPGTYSIYDFGRFINDFKAFDVNGQALETDSITANRRLIKDAKRLVKISYWVDDTYDMRQDNVIFEPAGTNIEDSLNFVINTFGFVGYLQGKGNLPYQVRIEHPKEMWGATALNKSFLSDSVDIYNALNYFELADGPIMYSKPDTTTFKVGDAEILVSVFSPGGVLTSDFVKGEIIPTLKAQKDYLGGHLPVDHYAFLIHLRRGSSLSGGFGALEHSYSSMYNLPEARPAFLAQVIRDVAAHEFFHIVTPLNIHSEEIGNFDFIDPKMSKHLWLYEGLTEYAASLAQVKYGEMKFSDYLDVMYGKIKESKKYMDTLPFTEMSIGCLNEYKKEYYNVYQKGALIGMALDIRLRELSNGTYGVQEMMADLAEEYGKNVSFKDEELFDKITAMTFPEIRDFFANYVEGPNPLPYAEFLEKVGVKYIPDQKSRELSLGHISFGVDDQSNKLVINGIDAMNTFGKNMGYQEGDIIHSFDGVEIDIENYDEEFAAFKTRHQAGEKISAVVLRKGKNGKHKKKKLTADAIEINVEKGGALEIYLEVNDEQLALRKAWVNQ